MHRGFFGTRRDLMSVQIMQPKLVDQGLFHLLMQDQEAIHLDDATPKGESFWQMTIDIDRLAVLAVACEIGDIVFAIELLDPAQDGV